IESSQISYVTSHRSTSATAVLDETVALPRAFGSRTAAASRPWTSPALSDHVQLSVRAGSSTASDREDLQDLTPKQRLAVLALEALLGRQVRLLHGRSQTAARGGGGPQQVHRRTEVHSESERTSFQAQGVVETADGRSIKFAATLNLQREFQSSSTTVQAGNTTDPLVVNFGGSSATLTAAKIAFDLNSDGKPENISFVTGGSGFLVLDRNGDGKATNGRELFGPQTGSGFAELASYDADGNGWIDEGDPV